MKKAITIMTFFCLLPLFSSSELFDTFTVTNITSLSGNHIYISDKDKSTIWISGPAGIKKYNLTMETWSTYTTAEGLPTIYGTEVFAEKDSIWIGTTKEAVLLDLNRGQVSNILLRDPLQPDYSPTVYSFGMNKNLLYVGTDIGLFGINKSTLDTVLYFNDNDGLGDRYVYSILTDEDYTWVTTAYGGAYIDFPPPTGGLSRIDVLNGDVVNYRYIDGYNPSYLYSMIQIGDSIWTENQFDLWLFNKTTKIFTKISKPEFHLYRRLKLFGGAIWFFAEDNEYHEFLLQLDPQSNSIVRQISVQDINDYFIQDSVLYLLSEDSLYYRSLNSDQLKNIHSSFLPERYCYAIAAKGENVYIGSTSYLTDFSTKDSTIKSMSYPDLIRDIQVDDNDLWVAGNYGLGRIDIDSWQVVKYYLSDKRVLFIVVDEDFIWASCTDGFYKVDKSSRTGSVLKKNYKSELNIIGTPAITGIVVDEYYLWLSFSAVSGGKNFTGIIKADKNNLSVLNLNKYDCLTPANKIQDIIDYGKSIICAGERIIKFDKDSLLFHNFIDSYTEKLALNGDILFASSSIIKAYNIKTGDRIFTLNKSNGLLNNIITDMYVTDDYLWTSTYGGISGFNISSITDVENGDDPNTVVPQVAHLYQNFPNPFNSNTLIRFDLQNRSYVNLSVYDNLGRKITTFVNKQKYAGSYSFDFNSNNLSSGVYYYILKTNHNKYIRRMILLK